MQFDAKAAKALKAGDHLTVADAPGLRLVASGAGRAWIYRYKSPLDGRMRQVKMGIWPAMSAATAGGEWERLRTERDAGHDPAQERRAARKAAPLLSSTPAELGTVGALVDAYVEHAAPKRVPKGGRELRRTVATMLPDAVRVLTPAQVTRSVAYDLVESYAGTPVQAAALRRELGAAWEWAHDAGRLDDSVPNWWRLVLRGKLRSAGKIKGTKWVDGRPVQGEHQGVQKRVLSVDEVGAVIRHLPHMTRLISDLLTLYLWTGCRGAELVQIEGREVGQDADGAWWWVIPKAKTKLARHPLAKDHPVPLVGRALEVVRARMDVRGDKHLFPPLRGKAAHVEQKVVGSAVWFAMPASKLRPEWERHRWPVIDWAPHDLRRTVRTQLAALGCPPHVAEAILGHIQPGVVGVYDRHEYRAERLEWLRRLAECWEAAAHRAD
ncbi:MAG: hypothetical protein RJA98_2634 [Pseudomonadota bacterium]|jgi:integrase